MAYPENTLEDVRDNIESFQKYIQQVLDHSDCTEVDNTLVNLLESLGEALEDTEDTTYKFKLRVPVDLPFEITAPKEVREDVLQFLMEEKVHQLLEPYGIKEYRLDYLPCRDYQLVLCAPDNKQA